MSVPYATNNARSKICSNSTLCRLRTLRHIWPAEMAASFEVENPAAEIPVPYSTTPDPESFPVIDSIELEVPENILADFDVIVDARARFDDTSDLTVADDFPSAFLGAPFVIKVRKVFVSTVGGVTLDTAFTPLQILVPRTWYDPALALAPGNAVWPGNTVHQVSQNLQLGEGRYVIDLTLQMDDQYWASINRGANLPDLWHVHGYTAPTGFTAYSGIDDLPILLNIRPNFLYGACTKDTTFVPLPTAQKTYLCTNSVCTESDDVTAVALDACLSTCT